MGRTSYTSNMFSLKLVLCVGIIFVVGMEAAPKPKPKAEPKPQPKAEPNPFGYPSYYNRAGHDYSDYSDQNWPWNLDDDTFMKLFRLPPRRKYYPGNDYGLKPTHWGKKRRMRMK